MEIKSPLELGGEVVARARQFTLDLISDAIALGIEKSKLVEVTNSIRDENQQNFDRVNESLNQGFHVNIGKLALIAKPKLNGNGHAKPLPAESIQP